MDIEEAKKVLTNTNNPRWYLYNQKNIKIIFEAIETVLSELDKKDKIINAMAEIICKLDCFGNYSWNANKNEVIDYFTKKVEE